MKFEARVGTIDILGHLILWLLVIIFTLGIGAFFFPYSFAKFILNRSVLVEGDQSWQLSCELNALSQIGHILLWILISILTLGIGFIFYQYKVWNLAISQTRVLKA